MVRVKKKSVTAQPKNKFRRWKRPLAAALVVAGIVFFVGFSIAHWVERQLLTTDNWVELVAPLPKDPAVSWSLADYSVERLFTGIDVETKVTNALPSQAAFLAKPLTERVETAAVGLAQDVITSDKFQGAWVAANREAHSRLMEAARSDEPIIDGSRANNLQLRLDSLTGDVRERLGDRSDRLFDGSRVQRASENAVSITVDLKSKMDNFRRYVAYIDFANATFLLAALASFAGALALSANRYKLASIVLVSLAVVSLLQLVGIRVLRPEILNEIARTDYRPAVAIIYDELTATFRRSATSVLVVSLAVLGIMALAKARFVNKNKTIARIKLEATKLALWQWIRQFRLILGNYRWLAAGVVTLAVLFYMAFIPDFDWVGLVNAALVILLAVGLINLVSLQPKAVGRK